MRQDDLPLHDPPAGDRPSDRWMCGHHVAGAPCARGPSRRGVCPLDQPCRPQRTWHGHCRRWQAVGLVAIAAVLLVVFWNQGQAEIIKPGDLATPHAQILSGTMTSDRCGACHPQATASPLAWFSSRADGSEIREHADIQQSDRCLNCHHTTIDPKTAVLAHNLVASKRTEIRLASTTPQHQSWHDLLPSAAVDPENIQCNACHREHGGLQNDLSAVSDAQCQTCHHDRFGSFASSHPEWDNWPYGRGGSIAFNHATHAEQHFPASRDERGIRQFQCADCHRPAADNELTRAVNYERACQSCHDDGLRQQSSAGLELLAIPSLQRRSADRIGSWPAQATGFFDGRISPLAQLLIRSQSDVDWLLRDIPDADLSRIDDQDSDAVAAAQQIAEALRALLSDLATSGQAAVTRRLVEAGITESAAESLVRSLPTQLIMRGNQDWFSSTVDQENVPVSDSAAAVPVGPPDDAPLALVSDDDLLLPESPDSLDDESLLVGDPLPEDSLKHDSLSTSFPAVDRGTGGSGSNPGPRTNPGPPGEFNPEAMLPLGAWYRDDVRLAIQYRGGGHADPVLKAAIEVIGQLPVDDPIRRQLVSTPGVKSCLECHLGAIQRSGSWRSQPLLGRRSEFTKFSHGPHLNIASLADCRHCHRLAHDPKAELQVTLTGGETTDPAAIEFAPLTRAACVQCHRADAAGDACIQCHRYHIDPWTTSISSGDGYHSP